jgi:cytochrome c-type biogenesis protein CcmE
MMFIGLVAVGVLGAVGLAIKAFNENLLYFQSPTMVMAGEAPTDRRFRLGGLVVEGSVERATGSMTANFLVTDTNETIPVEYTGVLPDLFKEGKGVVAHGVLNANGLFVADTVLAKHDENYMAPEVEDSLAEAEKLRAGP